MNLYTTIVRPVLFRCDAERVHAGAIAAGRRFGGIAARLRGRFAVADPRLATRVAGIDFANPVGLAAGFDKSGEAVRALAGLGFGALEIGSISADPSDGNPKPRLFRLPRDRAIVVHYGLPNRGAAAVRTTLRDVRLPVPLGINLVKTNRGIGAPPETAAEIIEDYAAAARLLKDSADYLTLNLSCPNTETGRDFFAEKGAIADCLAALAALDISCPVFLKVSPLGGVAAIERLLEEVAPSPIVSGFIFNLPPTKPEGLITPRPVWQNMPGAVSGRPVASLMDEQIRQTYRRMDRGRYALIGAGGIFTAEDAYRKIRLGASLVQILTALVYEGPGIVRRINTGLAALLKRDGMARVADAVGADA